MKLAVLSGKGGAGKTMLAVNLAACAEKACYVDCDVEEPNGRLFLKPHSIGTQEVFATVPVFDGDKCTACRKCVDFCRFNALLFIKGKPMVFNEVCHGCGGCMLVCPEGAVSEQNRPVGLVELGQRGTTRVVTGILTPGEASGVGTIHAALKQAQGETIIIDCPPGSACSVMESVADADFCLLVAEPTTFGFHNFRMVHELVTLLQKPCGVVINKLDAPYPQLERYCAEHSLPILERFAYDEKLAALSSRGELISEKDEEYKQRFCALLEKIGGLI